MSWKSRPLSAKCVSWRRISASGSSVPRRRSPPADSTNCTYGSRFSREISSARLIFLSETAVMAPPSTVGSWPHTTHSTPETTPMPETNPPPTVKSVPQPARGLSSRKGASRSSKSSMRSRMRSLPRSRCRATLRSPPPARASASWASTSARRASMSCRFRRKRSEPVSTRDRTTSMSVRAMMTAPPAAVNPAAESGERVRLRSLVARVVAGPEFSVEEADNLGVHHLVHRFAIEAFRVLRGFTGHDLQRPGETRDEGEVPAPVDQDASVPGRNAFARRSA